MKKQGISLLTAITIAFLALVLGIYLGRKSAGTLIQVSVSEAMQTLPPQLATQIPPEEEAAFPININTATKEELMALPGIGQELAQRILDYREAKIVFTAPEELLNVDGIGTDRLEEILYLITVGG